MSGVRYEPLTRGVFSELLRASCIQDQWSKLSLGSVNKATPGLSTSIVGRADCGLAIVGLKPVRYLSVSFQDFYSSFQSSEIEIMKDHLSPVKTKGNNSWLVKFFPCPGKILKNTKYQQFSRVHQKKEDEN